MDYQAKHAGDKLGDAGKDLNDTLRLLHELTDHTPLNRVVDTQINKVNQARGKTKESSSYVTRDLIEKEGRDADAVLEDELGIRNLGDRTIIPEQQAGPV